MNKAFRIYRMIDKVMMYAKKEVNKDLVYDDVKSIVINYCEHHPKTIFKTHVGDDYVARQIASKLVGKKIW